MKKLALPLLIAATVIAPVALVALADDASHATVLAMGSYDFDDGTGDEPAVIAALTSTDSSDWSWHITWFVRPPGGTEAGYGGSAIARDSGESSGLTAAIAVAGLSPGDTVRAHYETKSSTGVVRFSFDRTVVIP